MHQGSKEDWTDFFLRHNRDPKEIDQWIRKKKIKKKREIFILDRTKINNKLREEIYEKSFYRVCCFSATKLNILMWSHYTENHQGICLCFKTHKIGNGHFLMLDSKQQVLFPVEYVKQKPKKVNLLYKVQDKGLLDFFMKKYQDWGYENEYRILIKKDEFEQGYTKKFRKEDLEGVIFGLNTKPEKIKEIYEIIDTHYLQHGIKINLYSTHKIQGEFAIKVKKIDSFRKYLKKIS